MKSREKTNRESIFTSQCCPRKCALRCARGCTGKWQGDAKGRLEHHLLEAVKAQEFLFEQQPHGDAGRESAWGNHRAKLHV